MSSVVDAIEDLVNSVTEFIEDLVKEVWDAVVEPILEEIFSWFGIEDETVVTVQRISAPVFSTYTGNVVEGAIAKAVVAKVKSDTDYFPQYMEHIYKTKAQMKAYYLYAANSFYYAGLPNMTVHAALVDFDDVQAALDTEFGSTHTVISATSHNPNRYEWAYYSLQGAPYYYKGWTGTLTYTSTLDSIEYDDWAITDITYNAIPDNYTVSIERAVDEGQFWIEGPKQVTEGDSPKYIIKCNRIVPIGKTVTINFTYAGTAVDGVDYDQQASVDMIEGTQETNFSLNTYETANADRTIIVTIDSIDDPDFAWGATSIHPTLNTITTTITDDDTLQITVNDYHVDEANVTIDVQFKLEQAAPSGAFSVGYNFTDLGSITGGVDYDNTPGTLNFNGTAGEVNSASIDIYADVADDDYEQFEVFLENSTDVDGIDISAVSTITIVDGSGSPAIGTGTYTEQFTMPAYTVEDSLIVTYTDDSDPTPGQFRYWIYPHSNLTYDLQPTQKVISGLEVMPMAILRKDKTNIDTLYGTSSTQFITTRLLMKRIDQDLQAFLDAISSNPDASDVDDAYFNMSISPQDTHPLVSKLLYLSWYDIVVSQGLSSNTGEYTAKFSEGDIQNAIAWKENSFSSGVLGVVTDEGSYTHVRDGEWLRLRYQATATTYDEIGLKNLNGMTSIEYAGYHEVALCTLGDSEFTIPLSWQVYNRLSAKEMLEVYQHLFRLDFNAVVLTHIEWYETEAFADLFQIVMIVITIITLGAGSVLALALNLIYTYAVSLLIGELIIFIAEATGNNALAAAVGVIAGLVLSNPKLVTEGLMVSAEILVNASIEFAATFESLESQDELEHLQEELETEYQKLQAEIDKAKDQTTKTEDAVTLDANFLAAIQSVDTLMGPAIQGIYNYDAVYDYDMLVGRFNDSQLSVGVS